MTTTTMTMTTLRLEKKLATLPRTPRHRLEARTQPADLLHALLDPVAARMASDATSVPMPVLTAIAVAIWDNSPGAAAALVDRNGPEVARQRAFGTAYGVVLHVLDVPAQRALLERLSA